MPVFSFPFEILLLFIACLVVSSQGFIKFVYFISTGYGFSIAGMAIASLVLFRATLHPIVIIQTSLLLIYGVRLATFLAIRESSSTYRKAMRSSEYGSLAIALPLRVLVWITVALLYTLMFLPCLLNLSRLRATGGVLRLPLLVLVGVLVMGAGLSIEGIADFQKSRFKQRQPDRFCSTGLFSIVRCPNYLGEIIFWAGMWTSGIGSYTSWPHWVASIIGFVCIVLIMFGSTRRLEISQEKRYRKDPAYNKYVRMVPVLFPIVPVYSLKKWKLYLG